MKRCPSCNRTFTEPNLSFCIDDGTPLVEVSDASQPAPPAEADRGISTPLASRPSGAPAYQPPGSYVPPGSQTKERSSVWPWLLGFLALVLLGLIGLGVAAVIFMPRLLRATRNNPAVSISTPQPETPDANANANESNENSNLSLPDNQNANTATDSESPPTDPAMVLSELTDLENEWTRANINADKKALDRILADDFVGTIDGKAQGKAEYLRTIERDTAIETWSFDNLKLDLKGDRATLSGIVKFVVDGQELRLRFVDKFVWRDGRWQATASEVNRI